MTDRTCMFEGCDKRSRARGLCEAHYRQLMKGQELRPLFSDRVKPSATLSERLAIYTRKSEGCWEWMGGHNRFGYARMKWNGTGTSVYRVVWESEHGPVPRGMHVDHMCRNKGCVNPAHLQVVTPKENGENASLSKANTSGARGVTWSKAHGKWVAQVTHHRRNHYVGLFRTIEEADAAVREKRNELFTNNLADLVHA
ncbi:HNH endonuclease [Microbacterium sp. NPDC088619]|uniref:HNH endonuclease n=1 Tax=Microbacterium sp. NPDC088619 TaxID=3364196 RepID=UPI0037FE4280